jgi:MFS family permease
MAPDSARTAHAGAHARARPTRSGRSDSDEHPDSHGRDLRHGEKVRLAILGLPTMSLALSITVVTTYLGRVTRSYTHDTILIGAILAGEGLMALWIPLIAGAWSDTLRTRLGGRLPFVLAGAVPAAAVLAVIGFVHSLVGVAVAAELFFAAYFVAYEPYRAMYPDLMESDAVAGRSQSAQAIARGSGTGLALLGGGLLLSVGRALPFLVSAVVLVATTAGFTVLIVRRGLARRPQRDAEGPAAVARRLLALVREHPELRDYLGANAMWEATLASLKAFVILYMTIGLGYSLRTSSLIVGGVALGILAGAAAAGKLGDRLGLIRVVTVAVAVYGIGYLVPIFTTSRPAIGAALPLIALGGGALMTLAYAVLMPLMPEGEEGALTGFYSLSRGLGIVTGTLLAGALIEVGGEGPFRSTHGFAAMWTVCAAGALGSLIFVRRLRRRKGELYDPAPERD